MDVGSIYSPFVNSCKDMTCVFVCVCVCVWLVGRKVRYCRWPAARSRQILRDPARVANVARGDSVNRTNYVPNYGGPRARVGTDPVDGNVIGIRQRCVATAPFMAHVSFTYSTTLRTLSVASHRLRCCLSAFFWPV